MGILQLTSNEFCGSPMAPSTNVWNILPSPQQVQPSRVETFPTFDQLELPLDSSEELVTIDEEEEVKEQAQQAPNVPEHFLNRYYSFSNGSMSRSASLEAISSQQHSVPTPSSDSPTQQQPTIITPRPRSDNTLTLGRIDQYNNVSYKKRRYLKRTQVCEKKVGRAQLDCW